MKKLLVVFVLVLAMIMAVNAVAEETEITYESSGVQVPAT